MKNQPLLFELGKSGRRALDLPALDVPVQKGLLPATVIRSEEAALPELSQLEVMRHYTQLSNRNFGVDTGFYPLGSCTMKYNPKINEDIAKIPGLSAVHPLQNAKLVQGSLRLIYEVEQALSEIAGMAGTTMQPVAGAHGELTGLKLIRAYHRDRGDLARTKVIVPDSAHGTNPASATMCGMEAIEIKSEADGSIDLAALRAVVGPDTAALMLTNPSTLGLFETQIKEIAEIVHDAGGLLYYDGANANAIMGIVRPGDMGFDVVHFNLHKTFSTPHGGGGPGAGPIGVREILLPFLPEPRVIKNGENFEWAVPTKSIGKVHGFYGNFGIFTRAYAYILSMGAAGLRQASEDAVLNANYCKKMLEEAYDSPFDRYCMHECIVTSKKQKAQGIHTLDIAKRLLDYGYHPPTIYFPLIVEEAMMIEPTETESKETLDGFIEAMKSIAQEAEENPEVIISAPHHTVVSRLDETLAARKPVVKWEA
ncbi:MAG TPA: aminomethyl-transferring glycine dehydrogenase subunit GcvPB [Candidatus Avacidaminococcus intestinavium]|uniref:Probable glycine dehydrogenase (decarboxylating) subunit 2 n=1 Tax=Candidatus Avacidaminococcus intestinavium TaxID=2840684 RepID=A0A9D1MRG2_9FIRM|nr:aminomethyl-transferring glycine dehydrogenase subunit GcvPB [Candidatus Avacidaminococcus intestinavium]